jgi:predicted GH43/DUF377 family glycosyl hydrolase
LIVVIPFCCKDEDLAVKNLLVAQKLQGGQVSSFECLLSYDTLTNPARVLEAATSTFSKVHQFFYEPLEGKVNWPGPQNHAWQSVARHIYTHFRNGPWFWWEGDAVPLVAGWLDKLNAEYVSGAKPFMGHIVDKLGHMNGVAVYPWNVIEYSSSAMITRHAAWDVALKNETIDITHKANKLMVHFPRFNGIKFSFTDRKALDRLKKDGAVLFHGCNDGTLQDLVMGKKPKPSSDDNATVFTLETLTREFDEAEPLWQQESVRLSSLGYPYASYSQCRKPVESFQNQTDWDAGVFDLPLTERTCHFNPGLCRDDNGQLWLLARRWDRKGQGWNSTLVVCELDNNLNVKSKSDLVIPKQSGNEQHEDARVVFHDGKFWVSYCSWVIGENYSAKQVFSSFTRQWNFENSTQVPYGNNSSYILGNEKNWVWFNQDNLWSFVYRVHPHVVVSVKSPTEATEYRTQSKPAWKFGEIRGGTPPVKVGDNYISFFHSSMPWKGRQKRYYMGAYMFEAQAPYKILAMTKEPLLAGSEKDSRTLGGPPVVFAQGSIFENNIWTVSLGLNDEQCGWVRIPHKDLQEKLCPI